MAVVVRSLVAWAVFFVAMAVLRGLDYILRLGDGNVRTGGLGEPLLFGLEFVAGCVAAVVLVVATRPVARAWLRALIVAGQLGLGFVVYAFAALAYVIGAGIDAL